jgi:hypothetical protein
MKALGFTLSWLAIKAALTVFASLPSVKHDESLELLISEVS